MAGKKGQSGGPRPNSGRKKSQITLARDAFLKQQEQHAQDAFAYHVDVMNDPTLKTEWRMAAGQIVMARVWGKETNNEKVDGEVLIRIIRDGKRN